MNSQHSESQLHTHYYIAQGQHNKLYQHEHNSSGEGLGPGGLYIAYVQLWLGISLYVKINENTIALC